MKAMRDFGSMAVLLLGVAACSPHPAMTSASADCAPLVEAIDPSLAGKLDPIIDSALSRGFAGGVTVMRGDAIIYNRLAGDASLSEEIAVTDETLFHVASITKYFTAALVMKAAEEGKFSLNDSIGVLAPDTQLATRGVTFNDLLSHQSGLGSSYVAEEATTADAAIAAIDAVEIDEEMAGGFRYSNDGYDLLTVLLERAYGHPYEALLQEKIFAPACLSDASHSSLVDLADPRVVSQPLRPISDSLRKRNYGMLGSQGLLISAAELAAYEAALTDGKILSSASLEEMIAPRGDTSIGKATFGAFLAEDTALGRRLSARGSEDWGDNAIMNHYLERDIIVAVVTSRGPAEDSGAPLFRNEIAEAIERVLAEFPLN